MRTLFLCLLIICASTFRFIAQTPLLSPTITSVTNASVGFDNNGAFEIIWYNNTVPTDIDSFIIYKYTGWNTQENIPQYQAIDKIVYDGQSIYRFTPIDELNKVVFYAVEVVPKNKTLYKTSSTNLTRVPWKDAPSNILLQIESDTCNGTITLKWNKFYGWGSISRYLYRIEYTANSGPIETIYFNGSEYLENDTLVVLPNNNASTFTLSNGVTYAFRVTVINPTEGFTCTSNVVSYTPKIPKVARWINADGLKVLSKNKVEVTFTIDPENELNKLLIYRSNYDNRDFEPIDTILLDDGNMATFIDSTLNDLDKNHYYYKATLINPCNVAIGSIESNIVSNILLTLSVPQPPQNKNLLSWDFYRYFRGDVKEYIVHRYRKAETLQIGTTIDNKMVDDLSDIKNKQVLEEVCYQVEAVEENNPYGINGHVWSNEACMTIQATVEMPKYLLLGKDCKSKAEVPFIFPVNAFTPSNFYMAIFDRWGTKVFETDDPSEGWYGDKNGSIVPQGAYLYYIKFSGNDNVYKEQKGTFVVMCPEKM